jgi:hypothetical protein
VAGTNQRDDSRRGREVRHFTLLASGETVNARARDREGGLTVWVQRMNDLYFPSTTDPRFATFLGTDGRSAADVAADLAGRLDL